MEIVVSYCHSIIFIYKLLQPIMHIFKLFCFLIMFPILNSITFGGLYQDRPVCRPINFTDIFSDFDCADVIYWTRVIMENNPQPQCGLIEPYHYLWCKVECDSFYSTSPCFWQATREIIEIFVINTFILFYFTGRFNDIFIKMRRNWYTPGLY